MKRTKMFLTTTTLFTPLLAYLFAIFFRDDRICNIMALLSTFAAAGALLFAYIKSDRTKLRKTLLILSLACFVWAIADSIWAISYFMGGNPDESVVLWILYSLTNCLLTASLLIYIVNQLKKWDLVQTIFDLAISVFLSAVMFWILFLNKDLSILRRLLILDFTSLPALLTDVLVCTIIFSWFLSVRSGKIPAFLKMISAGLVLFAFVDILYYYEDYHGMYFPNTWIDFVYVSALDIIAFGSLWKLYKSDAIFDLAVVMNTGGRNRWMYVLLYPFAILLASYSGIVKSPLSIHDFALIFVPILLYWAGCRHIRYQYKKEALLKNNNSLLQQRVTEQVNELAYLTNQDMLTSLYNRRYFIARLDTDLKIKDNNDPTALLLIDLDRFKVINDTFGHDVGDKVLIDISHRMVEWNKFGAMIARLGGDEFAIRFHGSYSRSDIEDFCSQIIDLCNQPVKFRDITLHLTISLGVALATEECDGKELMQRAEIAMYRAKAQGYNMHLFYDPLMSNNLKKAHGIEVLLRQPNVEKDFELFYQPQFSLPDKKLIGAEALMRWRNPEYGYIPPDQFIPVAEQINYISKIGKWVMKNTISQAIQWNRKYSFALKLGFNISPKQLLEPDFIASLKAMIDESKVNTDWIDAEITESVMMNEETSVKSAFFAFHELGISVSLDDFGSGFSSLGNLNKYPFDRIKIDKSLIDQVSMHNIKSINIIRAAINIAHATGIQVIAEGVERQEQLDILIELGCDQAQGYLLGRPVPVDNFEQWYIGATLDTIYSIS